MPVIIPDELKPNLFKYKYNGVDKSLLSRYVLGHYWNWLVSLFPMTMAPNLITLSGLLCIFANFALQLYYDPDYGIGLWVYASFDAIDGKQARRTGTSGPLGELFDHSKFCFFIF
ncbi:hypothetical protein CONCODRAFT_58350 [Conidiobolus coronatus NRRL 28638]|uniref:Uncharacterized protein n=1 Tax=Conidiobolus coronatus (strain ATCC 28846 / CBS 209.66 / NRRL 28638) TaxID=796925 RepID=A0A137P656_CONC2|nr:hypothetical protein CONCODRAFT_58350 [Conidiobolus coronatus NRRL 28638]|eukprot:KXN70487.1 hypothetical protein CONCODRAFT_58350 [Conidiobolus coronatus NRRL 28638]